MAQSSARPRTHQAPCRAGHLLLQSDAVTGGQNVHVLGAQSEPRVRVAVPPPDESFPRVEGSVLRHIVDVRKTPVDGMAVRLRRDQFPQQIRHVGKRGFLQADRAIGEEILSQHVRSKGQRAARVFLFARTEQVGRKADLCLHLLLAITVVVVRDQRDHHAARIPARYLERAAAVIGFVFVGPAHSVAPLPLGSLAGMRQPQSFFPNAHQVRRQHDTAGVSGPMRRVEPSVVFGKVRIAAVAENALDKIEVADQTAGRDKPDFHGLLRFTAGRRTNQRPQQQRDETARGFLFIGGERQRQQIGRRIERRAPQRSESLFGHGSFVGWNRKPALRDVK